MVVNLAAEFSDKSHVKGIVSMARGDGEDSASTSFFIVTGEATELDGVYTVFGRVVEGMGAVEQIESAATDGETPINRIELRQIRLERN